ncbi:hypothetical protein KKE60_06065 [Patescibacteria group bacterium]|nr:hypothetical protein [Patescibacteria group bacterium]
MSKYKISDKVWYAQGKRIEKRVPCPDCFGQKALTVIRGDGSQVSIECVGCATGYEPPRGYITFYEQIGDVLEVTIDRIGETALETEYGFKGCYYVKETDLFAAKEDAEQRALVLAEEHNQEELNKINQKEKHNRSWAWNVHYHNDCIVRAEKQLAYHKAKLAVAKIKTP